MICSSTAVVAFAKVIVEINNDQRPEDPVIILVLPFLRYARGCGGSTGPDRDVDVLAAKFVGMVIENDYRPSASLPLLTLAFHAITKRPVGSFEVLSSAYLPIGCLLYTSDAADE